MKLIIKLNTKLNAKINTNKTDSVFYAEVCVK